jgi:hypothetical protein
MKRLFLLLACLWALPSIGAVIQNVFVTNAVNHVIPTNTVELSAFLAAGGGGGGNPNALTNNEARSVVFSNTVTVAANAKFQALRQVETPTQYVDSVFVAGVNNNSCLMQYDTSYVDGTLWFKGPSNTNKFALLFGKDILGGNGANIFWNATHDVADGSFGGELQMTADNFSIGMGQSSTAPTFHAGRKLQLGIGGGHLQWITLHYDDNGGGYPGWSVPLEFQLEQGAIGLHTVQPTFYVASEDLTGGVGHSSLYFYDDFDNTAISSGGAWIFAGATNTANIRGRMFTGRGWAFYGYLTNTGTIYGHALTNDLAIYAPTIVSPGNMYATAFNGNLSGSVDAGGGVQVNGNIGFTTDGAHNIRMPTNTPTDGYVFTAVGTAGYSKWAPAGSVSTVYASNVVGTAGGTLAVTNLNVSGTGSNYLSGPTFLSGDINNTNGLFIGTGGIVVSNALGNLAIQSGNVTNTGYVVSSNGFSSRGVVFVLMPTNSPTDGQAIVAVGTAGYTKFGTVASGGGPTFDNTQFGSANSVTSIVAAASVTNLVSSGVVGLTDASTVAVDLSQGNYFKVTLGGNRTLGNPTNPKNGQQWTLEVTQDSTGNRTLAYSSTYGFAHAGAPGITGITLTTNANYVDFIKFVYRNVGNGTNYVLGTSQGY